MTATNSEGSASATSGASTVVTAASGTGIRYLYDNAGRLHVLDDPSQGAAVYEWDADGNLTSIKRYPDSTVAVLAITPSHAPPGSRVDITGTGFGAEKTDDAVTFNGTPASVEEADTTDLIVTVPTGTTEGPVAVTVSGKSAESPTSFEPHAKRLPPGGQSTPTPTVSLATLTPPPSPDVTPSTTKLASRPSNPAAKKAASKTRTCAHRTRERRCGRVSRHTSTRQAHKNIGRHKACLRSRPAKRTARRTGCASRTTRKATGARRSGVGRVTFKPVVRTASSTKPAAAAPAAPSGSSQQAPGGTTVIPTNYKTPYPATWDPTASNRRDENWTTGRSPSPWANLRPLSVPHGATGISGQALVIDGTPLAGVTLEVQGTGKQTKTDHTGRFVLDGLSAGHQVLVIDGESADHGSRRYGRFIVGVEVTRDKVTPLGYTIWMTPLEPAGNKTIHEPLKHETVLTNTSIPGLQVKLPAGTTIRSSTGALVHNVNLTAVPVDRPPFPLPLFATGVPTYFTVQPGGAYLSKGAQIVYPNWGHVPAGQRVDFWNYDPTDKGWYVYGKGTVSANGQQVIPDPNVRVWEFTGAMITTEREAPEKAPRNGASTTAGDPVDLYTGLFVYKHTDLSVPDSLMPIALTRTYRPEDDNSYSFGVGAQSTFDLHLWSNENYKTAYLVLPDGSKIKYVRTSAGGGYKEAEYAAKETAAESEWNGSVLYWSESVHEWVLRRRDGMKFMFPIYAPLKAIEDRNGNRIALVREGSDNGPVVQARTPHGGWISMTYDSDGRIIKAGDSAGQIVRYQYNGEGYLIKAIDPMGHVTRYAYGPYHEGMTKVIDARGNTLIENKYDEVGAVSEQTLGKEGTYKFKYYLQECGRYPDFLVCPVGFTEMEVENPAKIKRRLEFREGELHAEGAYGDGEIGGCEVVGDDLLPSCWSYHVVAKNWLRNYSQDGFGEEQIGSAGTSDKSIALERNESGDITKITQYGERVEGGHVTRTQRAISLAYNEYSEPTSITDPLGRTDYTYDSQGNLTTITDPAGHRTAFGYDGHGELTSVTDPEGNTTHYTYEHGRRVSNTDPQGHETKIVYDSLGQPVGVRDPEGKLTEFTYNNDNELTSETNPAGEKTTYEYDADGNLTSVTDPRGHTQTATYTPLDQVASWTNDLGKTTTYEYNLMGQLSGTIDPKGQHTSYTYDELNRLESASFGATGGGSPTSNIAYGYDMENNVDSVKDSRAGNYTLSYDLNHDLTEESGPNGTVGYSYNTDSERTGMTIGGEEAKYAYNEDGQLTSIDTPHGKVSFGYDADGRTSQTVLPDGDSENYSYEPDSQAGRDRLREPRRRTDRKPAIRPRPAGARHHDRRQPRAYKPARSRQQPHLQRRKRADRP